MVPDHTHCHCGTGLHGDVGGEPVQGNSMSIHVLLEDVVSDFHFFVHRRVDEPHEQTLDVDISYFNVCKRTRKQEIYGEFG